MSEELILLVRCPHCGAARKAMSIKRVLCFKCGKHYFVMKKGSASNIVKIVKGDMGLLQRRILKNKIYILL